ncbi:MAG: hypothetical protein KBD51_01150 [Candidatus Levybacteria bacterium]|nr:hypothetical protein [Candidatus Levybacteria bacterium]
MDIQRLREIFDRESSFAIVVGHDYTIDEMGASLSLYLTLSSLGKDVSVISTKQPLVEVSNLVGIDRVKSGYESKNGDLVVSFPYQGDEIGKVSYTLEAGFLNIIVKPKENALSFGEKDVLFRRSGEVPRVLIAVGVKRLSELSSIFNIEALKDTTIINIDKAGNNEGFGDIVMIGQSASSVSEQVTNVMLTLAYPIDPDVAQNLLSGIVYATGDFQSSMTSSLAFEMAGILLRSGAVREGMAPVSRQVRRPVAPIAPITQAPTQPVNNFVDDVMPNPSLQQVVSQRQARATSQARSNQAPFDSTSSQSEFPSEQKKDDAPPDWLAPKIYKGSTNVE